MAALIPDITEVINNLSGPTTLQAAPATTTLALKNNITVYYLPENTLDKERRSVMAAMTLCGRSQNATPIQWQTFVLTWSVVCFPEFHATLVNNNGGGDYRFVPFSRAHIDSCEAARLAQADEDTAGKVPVDLPPHLPPVEVLPEPEIYAAASIEGIYAYYSMLLFIMAKSITPQNSRAIGSQRPLALIRKRNLQSSEFILIGDGKILAENYPHIQGGWVRATRPRRVILTHLAALCNSSDQSEVLEVIKVNMEMISNAGQSYIFYIRELLLGCDYCIQIPALRAAYWHFSRMVRVLAAQPKYLQPFYKLMMMDDAKDVRRRDIEALIGVATFYAAQTKRSMRQYRINEDIRPVIQAFIRLSAQHGHTFIEYPGQATTEVATV